MTTTPRSAHQFCPTCGCLDLVISPSVATSVHDPGEVASCPNCGWKGDVTETIGAVVNERLWTVEDYAEATLRVLAIHATAPLIQLFTFQGLMPSPEEAETPADKAWAEQARDRLMKAVFEAAATAAFTTAADIYAEQTARQKGKAN